MSDISVIIVSYNTADMLRNCLNSISEQSENINLETIVIDNASKDGSPSMVKKEFPHVRLIENEENLGFAKANNEGIRKSHGRYIALVNSDVVILNSCLQKLVSFMDENPDIGMTGPKILNPDLTLQPQCRYFPTLWNNFSQSMAFNKLFPKSRLFSGPFMKYWPHDQIRQVDVLTGCFWFVREKAVQEVGLLDEDFFMYGEDIDWCKRFHKKGWKVVFFPDSEAIHFGGVSSKIAPIKYYLEMQKSDLLYWKKHRGQIGKISYCIILILRHFLRIVVRIPLYLLRPSKRNILALKINQSFQCILLAIGLLAIVKKVF